MRLIPFALLGTAFITSQAMATEPGTLELSVELSTVQTIVESSVWQSANPSLTSPALETEEGTLSLGVGVGYTIGKDEKLSYGIQYGYRNLGGEDYTATAGNGTASLKTDGHYHRINFAAQLPLTNSFYLIGRAGLSASKVEADYASTLANSFSSSKSKTAPYLAAGIGIGGEYSQFQLLLEHVELPDAPSTPMDGGLLKTEDTLNTVTLGASFYF